MAPRQHARRKDIGSCVPLTALLALALMAGCGEVEEFDAEPNAKGSVGVPSNNGIAHTSNDCTTGTSSTTAGVAPAFVSTDDTRPQNSVHGANGSTDCTTGPTLGPEVNIYETLSPDQILNLNATRGLQVLDLSDPAEPEMLGQSPMSGTPVALHVADDRAYVLLNGWHGYYDTQSFDVEHYDGGVVMVIDTSDLANLRVMERILVRGHIQASQLTAGGEALFVAFNDWEGDAPSVRVRGFSTSEEGLVEVGTLDLGHHVSALKASPDWLMVTHQDVTAPRSWVSLVDIRDVTGHMVESAPIEIADVRVSAHMDVYGDVLRVSVSEYRGRKQMQSWSIADLQTPELIEDIAYELQGEVSEVLFLENRIYVVVRNGDRLMRAFKISDDGDIIEIPEYVIDEPYIGALYVVADRTRFINVMMDGPVTLTLYDADMGQEEPFRARCALESVEAIALQDITVIEDAVSVVNEAGIEETGVLLVPYVIDGVRSKVQVVTFSPSTLTPRGVMDHKEPVRSNFLGEGALVNVSDGSLSTYDLAAPDAPVARGHLDVAPSYTEFFVIGSSHGVRLRSNHVEFYTAAPVYALPRNVLEVIPLFAEAPDVVQPVAAVEIPATSWVYQMDTLLIVVDSLFGGVETTLEVIDFSDPMNPRTRSTFVTDTLTFTSYPEQGKISPHSDDAYGRSNTRIFTVGKALVFAEPRPQHVEVAPATICNTTPETSECHYDEEGLCHFYSGRLQCELWEGDEVCVNNLFQCQRGALGHNTCTRIENTSEHPLEFWCVDEPRYRNWNAYDFTILDLSDPDRPALIPTLERPDDEALTNILVRGEELYYAYKIPSDADGGWPKIHHFARKITLSTPSHPRVGDALSLPGRLIAVEGGALYTQDFQRGPSGFYSAINTFDPERYEQGQEPRFRLPERQIEDVIVDGDGKIFVVHRPHPLSDEEDVEPRALTALSMEIGLLDALDMILEPESGVLLDIALGRAVFGVPGGRLVIDVAGEVPIARAYFPGRSWPTDGLTVHEGTFYMPSGTYGLHTFDLETFNLLPAQ